MVQTVVLGCFAGMLAVGMALGVPIVAILTAGFFFCGLCALSGRLPQIHRTDVLLRRQISA
jgi:hypothetical protein